VRALAAVLLLAGVLLGASGAYASDGVRSAWGFGLAVAALVVWLVRAARDDRSSGDAGDAGLMGGAALGTDFTSDSGGGSDGGSGGGDS